MLIVPVIAAWARLDSLAFALDRQSSCPIPFSKLPTFRSRPTRLGLEGVRVGGINVAEGDDGADGRECIDYKHSRVAHLHKEKCRRARLHFSLNKTGSEFICAVQQEIAVSPFRRFLPRLRPPLGAASFLHMFHEIALSRRD
jgi:hypothetical protein